MLPQRFSVEIHDGILCIGCETTDYREPVWIKNYWPTKIRAKDFLAFFGCTEADLPKFTVTQTYPGEYRIEHWDRWHNGQYVTLVDGAKTESIHQTRRSYEIKTRCQKEYRDGNWHVCRAGRWQRV